MEIMIGRSCCWCCCLGRRIGVALQLVVVLSSALALSLSTAGSELGSSGTPGSGWSQHRPLAERSRFGGRSAGVADSLPSADEEHQRIIQQAYDGGSGVSIDVLDFGADPTATDDSAGAFQRALRAASVSNATRTVYVPPGHYRFLSDLVIPQRVTLQGAMRSVESFAGARTIRPPFDGSVLEPHHGAGTTNGSFITVDTNSVLTGIIVYYPLQVTGYVVGTSIINTTEALHPTPYPWAVTMVGHNAAVLDCYLHNPYQGIGIGVDGQQSWRHLIRNVQGQPLRTGLYIDNVRDIGRVENVHWIYQFFSAAFLQYQIDHGRCFVIGRSDWQYFLNTFCLGYRIGYHFVATDDGATNGNFLGIAADASLIPVQINATNNYGVSITNGEFVSEVPRCASACACVAAAASAHRAVLCGAPRRVPALNCCTADATAVHVLVGPNTTKRFNSGEVMYGRAAFDNCAFWGGPSQAISLRGDAGFVLSVTNSVFRNWDRSNYAVEATGGSLIVNNCEFRNEGPQVTVGALVQRAVVTGNLATGVVNISVPEELVQVGAAAVANNVGSRGCAPELGGLDLCGPRNA